MGFLTVLCAEHKTPAAVVPIGAPTATTSATGSSSATITIPAGTHVGDYMVIYAHSYASSALATPSGWTVIASASPGTSNGNLTGFRRIATSGDVGGSTTVSLTGGSIFTSAVFASYSRVNTSSPIDVQSTRQNNSASLTDTYAGLTTTLPNDRLVVGIVGTPQAGGSHTFTFTGTAGATSRVAVNSAGNVDLALVDAAVSAAGATGSVIATLSGVPNDQWAWVGTAVKHA